VNKKINRENNRVKTVGDLQVLKPETKINSSSGTPASLSENPVKAAVKTYKSRILSKIQRMKYYPVTARRMNQEGVVLLRFILNKDGTLAGGVKIIKGCEHELLNRAGVKTIRKSLPFPSFPDSYLNDNIEFNVQLVYNLDLLSQK
jgi:protein TonB